MGGEKLMTLDLKPVGIYPLSNTASLLKISLDAQRDFNASGLSTSFTGSIDANTNILTLSAAWDGKVGQGIFLQTAGAVCQCDAPTGVTATASASGTDTITYAIVSMDNQGGMSAAASVTITDVATPTYTDSVSISWTAPTTGTSPSGYGVWVQVNGGVWQSMQLLPLTDGAVSLTDVAVYFDLPSYWPDTPPTSPTAQWLAATVTSINGDQVTLSTDALSTMTSGVVIHDDTAALNTFTQTLAGGGSVGVVPPGDYCVSGEGMMVDNSTIYPVSIFGYGATIHVQPGTSANGIFVRDSQFVNILGFTIDGNYLNVSNAGATYQSNIPMFVGTISGSGCTNVLVQDVHSLHGFYGGFVSAVSERVDFIQCFAEDNRDNAFNMRPQNNQLRIINAKATGSYYNGIDSIGGTNIIVSGAIAWDNGPSPWSGEGGQIVSEGSQNMLIENSLCYQSSSLATTQGIKTDLTVEGANPGNSKNVVIANCQIDGVINKTLSNGETITGNGILIQNSDHARVIGTQVLASNVGVVIGPNVTGFRLENVTIRDSVQDGCDATSSGGSEEAVCIGCTFHNNGSSPNNSGMAIDAQDGFEWYDCRFTQNAGEGLTISAGTNHVIHGGLVKDNYYNGFNINGSTGVVLVDGVTATNTSGATQLQQRMLYEGSSSCTSQIVRCVISGQTDVPYQFASPTSFAQGCILSSGFSPQVLSGSPSGTITWTQPEQGTQHKVFIATAVSYENDSTTNQTITFPTAFSYTPVISTNTTGLTVSASTTTLTITTPDSTTAYSGIIEAIGI